MIEVDVSEPSGIARLLEQGQKVELVNLNAQDWPDYKWDGVFCYCHGSNTYITERKTWNDLVSGLDDIEKQLARQMQLHPMVHKRLLIEGVAESIAGGTLVYRKSEGKNIFVAPNKTYNHTRYAQIVGWLNQVGKYWDIHYTSTSDDSAILLSVLYNQDQVDEDNHTTFKRMFKQLNYSINPQAQRILSASGEVRFGPTQAEAVATHFGTAIRAWRADVSEWMAIPGIGKTTAVAYLRGIGRGDV